MQNYTTANLIKYKKMTRLELGSFFVSITNFKIIYIKKYKNLSSIF